MVFQNMIRISCRQLTKLAQGKKLRIGVVGYGGRGEAIFRALGFAPEKWAKRFMDNGKPTSLLKNFLDQDDLNVEITGVCDTYPTGQRVQQKMRLQLFVQVVQNKLTSLKYILPIKICYRTISLMP